MTTNRSGIGELLLRERVISLAQLKSAQEQAQKSGKDLAYTLAKLGYTSENEMTRFLAEQYRVRVVNLEEHAFDPETLKLIAREQCEKHRLIPISRAGSTLVVAMANPGDLRAIDDVKFLTGFNVEPVVALEGAIVAAIERYYGVKTQNQYADVMASFDENDVALAESPTSVAQPGEVSDDLAAKEGEEAPIVRLVNALLVNAIKKRASDIHVEPYERIVRIRYRVDGMLIQEMELPKKLLNAVISRIKIMSNLDIAERRVPQDGRIKIKLSRDREMDYRVSILPVIWGEKAVLRLLDKSNLQLDMSKLGFDPKPLEDFQWAIHQPWGMVLVTGPTGSGKTTTLYSALSEMNTPGHNISTAEDPVEYNLQGINQVQIREDVGLSFAAALRSFLRQDPDVIMVGEIRDFETAEIAIKAALTGHSVLSTLHTNDAPATVSRLLNMGIEPFLITASLNLILAQRLARRICAECKAPHTVEADTLREIGFSEEQIAGGKLMKGAGCKNCNGSGYRGRVALYEVMRFNDTIRELILQGVSTAELKAGAIRAGMVTLRMAGIQKVLEGLTTTEEVLRVTMAD
jgi:type IV pilus assembly protein PilB